MDDQVVGSGAGSPSFIQLMGPGIEGEDLVMRADGTKLGEPAAQGIFSDKMTSATLDDEALKAQANLNLAAQLNVDGEKSVTLLQQQQLDNIKPDEPDLPIIGEFLVEAQKDLASGKIDSGGLGANPAVATASAQVQDAKAQVATAQAEVKKAQAIVITLKPKVDPNKVIRDVDTFVKAAQTAADEASAALAEGTIASDNDDLAAAKSAADKAQAAADKANKAIVDAQAYIDKSKISFGPIPQEALNRLEKAKEAASLANAAVITSKALVLGEEAQLDARAAVSKTETASSDAVAQLAKIRAAIASGESAVVDTAINAAKKAAADAMEAAAEAEAAAIRAAGTPGESGAKEIASRAKELASAAQSAANEGEAAKINAAATKAEADVQTAFDIATQAAKEAKLASGNAEIAAGKRDGPKAETAATAAAEARKKAQSAAESAMEFAQAAEKAGLPNAAKLMQIAVDAKVAALEAAAAASVAATASLEAVAPIKPNLFLAVNAYVVFLANYMEMIKAMMANKIVQNEIQLKTMDLIVQTAKDTQASILRAAESQADTYMTAAICSAVAFAGSVVSFGMTVKGAVGGKKEVDFKGTKEIPIEGPSAKMEPAIDANSPANQFKQSEWYQKNGGDAVLDANGQPERVIFTDKDGNMVNYEKYGDGGSKTIKDNFAKVQQDLYVNENGLTQSEITTKNQAIEAEITAYQDQLKQYGLEDPATAKGPIERERLVGEIQKKNADIKKENVELEKQNKKENEEIRRSNDMRRQFFGNLGEAIGNMATKGADVYRNLVERANAMIKGSEEGIQKMLESYSRMHQQVLSSATEAFKSDTDMVKEIIQQLEGLRQKLHEAVAALLRK